MNKAYTCHLCSHEFDLVPDNDYEMYIVNNNEKLPEKIKTKCPNCHEIYKINLNIMALEN